MPFRTSVFQENVDQWLDSQAREEIIRTSERYDALSTPKQKAQFLHGLMELLDREVSEPMRWAIMEGCGRRCIGASTLDKARRLKQQSQDLDDLLSCLNEAHIGGGHLQREGDVIHASYERCYCGSVSASRQSFSPTYCHCSIGWYRQLFESLLDRPVEVELLGSILQGEERCQFMIKFS